MKNPVVSTMKMVGGTLAAACAFWAAVGLGGDYLLRQNNIRLAFNHQSMADKCLHDVLDNDGVLRLPLPDWEADTDGRYSLYYMDRQSAPAKAAQLSPEIIAQCESLTGTKHDAAQWRPLLELRPQ